MSSEYAQYTTHGFTGERIELALFVEHFSLDSILKASENFHFNHEALIQLPTRTYASDGWRNEQTNEGIVSISESCLSSR